MKISSEMCDIFNAVIVESIQNFNSIFKNHLTSRILKNFNIHLTYEFNIIFKRNATKKYNGELIIFHVVEWPNLNLEAATLCIIFFIII